MRSVFELSSSPELRGPKETQLTAYLAYRSRSAPCCLPQVAHIDQYKRVVATPYVWAFPYIFGPTNVSLALVQAGLATVYRQSGAAYGTAGFFSRVLLNDPNGLGRLERAEKFAR